MYVNNNYFERYTDKFIKNKIDSEYKEKDNDIKEESISYNKLMIVVHPDDESIFGGYHLLNEEYVVVCVTCGVNNIRLQEFKKAMELTNDRFEYLSHTDLDQNNVISDWSSEYDTINLEIKDIINRQDWDLIVTHNPDGEYGHIQHEMISKIVTENVTNKDKLYYFGLFYDNNTENSATALDENSYSSKRNLLNIYESQGCLPETSRLSYMFRNENWILYNNWS